MLRFSSRFYRKKTRRENENVLDRAVGRCRRNRIITGGLAGTLSEEPQPICTTKVHPEEGFMTFAFYIDTRKSLSFKMDHLVNPMTFKVIPNKAGH